MRRRVCFFAPYLWPSFDDRIEFAGGAERQQAVLTRGLAARGFEVSVATCDFGQGRRVERDGVTFLATHPPFAGLPVLRFFHPRLTGNLRALFGAHADLFYERGSGLPAGLAHDVARARGAGFVFAAAHDTDAQADMPLVHGLRDRSWTSRAIRRADAIIAQTSFQQRLFRESWKRDSTVIPNLVELPVTVADAGARDVVLWVSTYKEAKRPEWVIELARRMPWQRFVMAGVIPPPPLSAAVFDATRALAGGLPNLEVRGHLDRRQLGELLATGGLFLHTSGLEGFPNTMLEAWAHGLPTVSVVDPDGIVARERLGEVAGDPGAMEAAVTRWMGDPQRRRDAGARAHAYVRGAHAPDAIVDRVAAVFDDVIRKVRGG